MTVLDVGQGDSIFVAFPDGRTMLVDGGGLTGSSGLMDRGRDRILARKLCRHICGRAESSAWTWWR